MHKGLLIAVAATQLTARACNSSMPEPQIPFAPKRYVCYRTAETMTIDGGMDEAAWETAPWTDTFVDIRGDLEPQPYLDTRAKILWDDTYFYFLFQLEDPHTRATFTEHDSYIFHEDSDIEIFIDPDGNTHLYFEIEENAFGIYWDLSLDKPYRDDGGWTGEFAFRWNSFHATRHQPSAPTPGNQWRVNFSRVRWELEMDSEANTYTRVGTFGDEENWGWSPQGLISMHYPEM